jgi:hypothetical protein
MSEPTKAISELFASRFGERVKLGPMVGGIVSAKFAVF